MSELSSTLSFLEKTSFTKDIGENEQTDSHIINSNQDCFFDIQKFGQELYLKSEEKNRSRANRANQNITGYDIAHNCIRQVLFKLRNTPIQNYADAWLPIFMRTEVGTAVHNFIQSNTEQFTETEINLKVPSIRFYGKIDYLINDSVLGEIKTCTYSDYASVLRKQQPREKDFLQAFCYHYILKNFLQEIQNPEVILPEGAGLKPKLRQYNIQKLQFIYVAHDIISSQAESYAEMLECVKTVKKNLNSKKNPFFFITSIVVDLDDELIENFHNLISEKFQHILYFEKTKTLPNKDNKFINTKNCFFCPYKMVCKF